MKISEHFALIDRGASPKARKATDFFIDDNITRLFGQCEFDENEADVMYVPSGIAINRNIYGDPETESIVIEVHANGLVCRSQNTGKLLFGIKRDEKEVADIYHDNIAKYSYAFSCGEDKFSFCVKDSTNGAILYDGSLSIAGVRDRASETFYLEVKTPRQEKNTLFKKRSANGFVQIPVNPYEAVDEYDYLTSIFGVLEDNQTELFEKKSRELQVGI